MITVEGREVDSTPTLAKTRPVTSGDTTPSTKTSVPVTNGGPAHTESYPYLWQITILVILGTACAGGGAWLMASGQFISGLGLWIMMLGCAFGASRCEPGARLARDASHNRAGKADEVMDNEVMDNEVMDKVTEPHVQPKETDPKVNWRCQIAVNPDSSVPADLLILTSSGIDLLSTAPEAWEALGNRNLSMAMTSKIVSDAIDGSRSWRDIADIELSRFDAFVAEHGYPAVAKASAPNVSYLHDSIAFAGVYRRRYVSSSYFEIELFDGTTDKRDLIADDEKLDALRTQLAYLGYQQRFRKSDEVA